MTLLNNLKVQERQNRVCTTVAIAIVAETCAPFTGEQLCVCVCVCVNLHTYVCSCVHVYLFEYLHVWAHYVFMCV